MTRENDLAVDCISRQATINAVKRIHPVDTDYDCTLLDKADVMYVLDEMPSVTPQEPRKGHWIEQNDDYYDWYECSECGYGSEGEMQYSNEYDVRTNYCPNCGAKMIEPQESEEQEDGNV